VNGVSTKTAVRPAADDADDANRLRRVETLVLEVSREREWKRLDVDQAADLVREGDQVDPGGSQIIRIKGKH